ncbi:hypothetical protein L0128_03930 [candidate division KSB1 bacterium]|nr:hypothetical protein [candidate division KSB1 bacterium]
MDIVPVQTPRQLQDFIRLPYQLRRHDPNWIPPLRPEQQKIFRPATNSMLRHCEYQLFLLQHQSHVIGRIAAFIDHESNQHWQDAVGLFGSYACVDYPAAASMLLSTAEHWLRARKMKKMRGPWSFVSQDWGLIVKGFEIPTIIMSSDNPPYYNQHLLDFGLSQIKDLLVYNCDLATDYQMPARFFDFIPKLEKRYQVTVRSIRMENLLAEVKTIVHLTNVSTSPNWGYAPISDAEAVNIAADLKMIVQPETILIAEIAQRPIGFLITLPDINTLLPGLNGHLWPFGIFKLLFGLKKINRYRIWALGIVPEYQRKGIPALMFYKLHQILAPKQAYVEANYVLEDNHIMNNTLRQLNLAQVKTYRIYEKLLASMAT